MGEFSVVTDAPARTDLLNFDRYVDPLLAVLTGQYTETPFTVGIFGPWGSGKSTLLGLLRRKLESGYPGQFLAVDFNPWVHRKEPNMLVPLLDVLRETLGQDPKKRFGQSAAKIATILLKLGADVVLRHVTAGAVSLEKLTQAEEAYHKERGEVRSEMRKLHGTLQQLANGIAGQGAHIVFFIDDLDRCAPLEIIDLLEAIKLFLDLQHVFVILAADKEVIDRGIEVKYKDFELGERKSALGAEYIEKMIQLPLHLFPLHPSQVRSYVETLPPPAAVLPRLDVIAPALAPNPRKIKRVVNMLAVAGRIQHASPALHALSADIVARLVVLQVQHPDLYVQILRYPLLLEKLELAFAGTLKLENDRDFAGLGELREPLYRLSKLYCKPGALYAPLFNQAGFAQVRTDLPLYFSMLGR